MLDVINFLTGLGGLQHSLISNWIGPIFILVVAGVSLKFLISRQIRELLIFIVIAAIVGLLIYAGGSMFGKSGKLKQGAQSVANNVNVIMPFISYHFNHAMLVVGNLVH